MQNDGGTDTGTDDGGSKGEHKAAQQPSSIEIGGWKVESHKANMSGEQQLSSITTALKGATTLPEMVFADNCLRISHARSGVAFSFTALDALRGWREEALPALKLKIAPQWMRARAADIATTNAVHMDYDWTFTTPYRGTTTQQLQDGDVEVQWQETTDRIDRSLLTTQDPILLYDEVVLYESELDDNGTAHLSVKVRVMPRCWFVLLRFFMRVDGMMVRLRETRFFCRFDARKPDAPCRVLRETRHSEATFDELAAAGAMGPASSAAFASADSAAMALSAIMPIGVKLFVTECCDVAATPAPPQ